MVCTWDSNIMIFITMNITFFMELDGFHGDGLVTYPDDDDRDGHRNVGILRTPNAADSPRRLYQKQVK
jgi:hypothetical protein